MTTKIISKPNMQRLLKCLRLEGYEVSKCPTGYLVVVDGTLMLKAMMGHNGYLVRFSPELLTTVKA